MIRTRALLSGWSSWLTVVKTLRGPRRRACIPAALLALLVPAAALASNSNPLLVGGPGHPMPVTPPGTSEFSAPAGAHLTYYGGRVVSSAQVVIVLWGTGSYLPQVSSTVSPSMATFYQGVLNSAYVDWLSEYNTTVAGGTSQTIGRGSFLQQATITPSTSASTVDDSTIQSELVAQINAGHLPAPVTDAAGNVNTIYMIYFPHGKTITQGGSSSCVAGGFCAYHGTLTRNGQHLYYGVMPDMQAGSGCDTGCGGSTPFGNYTSVSSHELVETITDAEVGLAMTTGPPLAWYDNTNGEIGDICNAQQGTIVGSDGVTYVVQKEFSNVANDCIVSRAVAGSDFSISVSPPSVSIALGNSGTATVSTTTTSGSAETVALSVIGLPAGVTGSFSPSSITSGQSSTLTLTVSSGASAASSTYTVTGTAASGTHAASGTLVVTSSGGGSALTNGGFETGNLTGWTAAGASETVVGTGCHGGSWCAQLGGTSATNGDSTIAQTFTAPSNATGLSLWYKETCPDTVTYDWAVVTLKDNVTTATTTMLANTCTTNAWTQLTAALTGGHSYTLTLTSHDDNYASDPTYTLFDDVTVQPSPPCLTNADCNDGNLCTVDVCDPVLGCLHATDPTMLPQEVTGLQVLRAGAVTTIAWFDQAAQFRYDVVSGAVSALRPNLGVANGQCLLNDATTSGQHDARANPAPGNGYYYIVRSQDSCGTGTYGHTSAGVEELPTAACP